MSPNPRKWASAVLACMLSLPIFSLAIFSLAIFSLANFVSAESRASGKETNISPVVQTNDAESMRWQGEQRFRANCGRCHAAPHKFPPRMMATVVRHMRVRATITDEDMRLVLFYMTQ
jgi:mono/diheme cytochrome c family protein